MCLPKFLQSLCSPFEKILHWWKFAKTVMVRWQSIAYRDMGLYKDSFKDIDDIRNVKFPNKEHTIVSL